MAFSTTARASGLTCGDPFTTRETVPRPTPACAATWSSVGRPADRARGVRTIAVNSTSRSHPGARPGVGAQRVVPDDVGVPGGTGFRRADLGRVVDMDEAEALLV